jgi:hypothetical protein
VVASYLRHADIHRLHQPRPHKHIAATPDAAKDSQDRGSREQQLLSTQRSQRNVTQVSQAQDDVDVSLVLVDLTGSVHGEDSAAPNAVAPLLDVTSSMYAPFVCSIAKVQAWQSKPGRSSGRATHAQPPIGQGHARNASQHTGRGSAYDAAAAANSADRRLRSAHAGEHSLHDRADGGAEVDCDEISARSCAQDFDRLYEAAYGQQAPQLDAAQAQLSVAAPDELAHASAVQEQVQAEWGSLLTGRDLGETLVGFLQARSAVAGRAHKALSTSNMPFASQACVARLMGLPRTSVILHLTCQLHQSFYCHQFDCITLFHCPV